MPTTDLLVRRCGVVDPQSLADYVAAGGFAGLRRAMQLLEEDPFAILEAITVAGFAVGAANGFVYIRGEYALAARRLAHAIDELRAHGELGPHVLGTDFAFDIEVRRGGGAYICGEETALMNSIEGRRGEPRSKPPFPTERGLFGQPTLMNNVETLANVPLIVERGGAWYRTIGVPGGIPLRALLEEHAVGVAGASFQAVLLGGAAGTYGLPQDFDTPLDYQSLRTVGASIGSGAIVAFNETVDMWAMVRRFAEFFAEESCGQCVPCRVGTVRQVEILHRVMGARRTGDPELLLDLGQGMQAASICGLGQTAATQVLSALDRFPLPTP